MSWEQPTLNESLGTLVLDKWAAMSVKQLVSFFETTEDYHWWYEAALRRCAREVRPFDQQTELADMWRRVFAEKTHVVPTDGFPRETDADPRIESQFDERKEDD